MIEVEFANRTQLRLPVSTSPALAAAVDLLPENSSRIW
jgi:hypothetical protein